MNKVKTGISVILAVQMGIGLVLAETSPPSAPIDPTTQPASPQPPAIKKWAKVEVLDKENNVWNKCIVLDIYQGAYKVECNYEKFIRQDIHVRKPNGAEPTTSAVNVATAPFKKGDIVLVSPMNLSHDWRIAIVEMNQVEKTNSYVVDWGYGPNHVLPNNVRELDGE